MSRVATHDEAGNEIVVGWDPPLQTFFGQVYRPEPVGFCTDDACELHEGWPDHALRDCQDNPPVLWVGASGTRILTVEALAEQMGTWGYFPRDIAVSLAQDRAANR